MPKVMLAGGGTGGHLFPALALADELRRRRAGMEIVFVGTKRGLEAKLVPEKGYRIRFLEVRGFRRGLDWRNLFFLYYLAKSLRQAKTILEEEKPDIVVGTGGYVSGPPLRVARKMRVPILIQEQNSYPGVTTRWLAHKADKVFLTYENSKKFFKRQDNLEIVGNPVRSDLAKIEKSEARRALKLDENKKVVLILGGSQGAMAINQAVLDGLSQLEGQNWLQIIWQTGNKDFERVNSILQDKRVPISAVSFIQDMAVAYAACDLVVSRAGALTLSEITVVGKPTILIPYPFAAADHQRKNAEVLVKENAAEMILEKDLSQTNLVQRVLNLIRDDSRLKTMSAQSRKLGRPEALDRIAASILSYLDKSKN